MEHLNMNIWILEIGMVMSHVILECKCVDLWPLMFQNAIGL